MTTTTDTTTSRVSNAVSGKCQQTALTIARIHGAPTMTRPYISTFSRAQRLSTKAHRTLGREGSIGPRPRSALVRRLRDRGSNLGESLAISPYR
jgi:hypothetical protein